MCFPEGKGLIDTLQLAHCNWPLFLKPVLLLLVHLTISYCLKVTGSSFISLKQRLFSFSFLPAPLCYFSLLFEIKSVAQTISKL